MILSVFICEDECVQREFMERTVVEHISPENYKIEIAVSTNNPITLFEYVKANPTQNSLYLLDVNLQHELCGISLAKKIREHDVLGRIVFVTTHPELSYLAFRNRIEAMDYIIKGKNEDVSKKIRECIDLTYRRHAKLTPARDYFQVKSSFGVRKIPLDDILFFESSHASHKLILHTKDERIEFRGKLKDVQSISADFFRCHRAYVVNAKNISRVQRVGKVGEVEMTTGAVAPVAEAHISALMRTVMA